MKKSWKNIPIGGLIIEAGNSVEFKTGDWKTDSPSFNAKKCISCMRCHLLCPEGCIKVKNGKIVSIDMDYCKGCGICAEECPVKAITMVKGCKLLNET